jgi:sialate O-acetylesterase
MPRRRVVALLLVALAAAPSRGEVRLNRLFSDQMVIQQGREVPAWGTADPGERVTVRFADQERKAVVGADGRWSFHLAVLQPGGPFAMTVVAKETRTVEDVYVGEV